MTTSIETELRLPAQSISRGREIDWLERCRASICESDPLLADDDVLILAAGLWRMPRCQGLLPEFAAGLLMTDQLVRLN